MSRLKLALALLLCVVSTLAAPAIAAPAPIDQTAWAGLKKQVRLPNGIRLAYVELGNPAEQLLATGCQVRLRYVDLRLIGVVQKREHLVVLAVRDRVVRRRRRPQASIRLRSRSSPMLLPRSSMTWVR